MFTTVLTIGKAGRRWSCMQHRTAQTGCCSQRRCARSNCALPPGAHVNQSSITMSSASSALPAPAPAPCLAPYCSRRPPEPEATPSARPVMPLTSPAGPPCEDSTTQASLRGLLLTCFVAARPVNGRLVLASEEGLRIKGSDRTCHRHRHRHRGGARRAAHCGVAGRRGCGAQERSPAPASTARPPE